MSAEAPPATSDKSTEEGATDVAANSAAASDAHDGDVRNVKGATSSSSFNGDAGGKATEAPQ